MFGTQFYPTPDELIDRMLQPYKVDTSKFAHSYEWSNYEALRKGKSILEPSAGKGNIIDRLVEKYKVRDREIACIEIDEELRMILSEKHYRIVDTDFLAYQDDQWFDLILMNPPFSASAEHLLKAWQIVADDGDVACILNAETIQKPYTKERQLLKTIIDEHGRYEFVENAFVNAERPTGVEVAIVWLHKPKVESAVSFDGNFERDSKEWDEAFTANPLASRNIYESLVAQYQGARQAIKEEHRQRSIVRFYISGVSDHPSSYDRPGEDLNKAIDELKVKFWSYVFTKTKLGRSTTSEFQKKFDQFQKETSNLAFSVENIFGVLDLFRLNSQSILEQCLIDTFDKACSYHKDNKIHVEGWKTNKSWRCARKIIHPYGVEYSTKYGESWSTSWSQRDFFMDLDKVCCFLDGHSIDQIGTLYDAIESQVNALNRSHDKSWYSDPFYSRNFKIKFFKKGTVHIEFRDENLWNQFNIRAAKGKNWVGDGS